MNTDNLLLRLKRKSERALASGALRSIATETEYVEQDGVRFIVRVLANLARKDAERADPTATSATAAAADSPFLPPYDDDLFVEDVSPSHVCLLNKFNVVEHHALIVTREFEDQERLLTRRDFGALWTCMAEFDALGFYNGGTIAGASQSHKHLQLVPLPLDPSGPRVPIEPLIDCGGAGGAPAVCPGLPFAHVAAPIDLRSDGSVEALASTTWTTYLAMMRATGLRSDGNDGQLGPYNLLVTRQWMLLVPRSTECFHFVSVNALGFAGAMLLRNREQLAEVRDLGPMTILNALSGTWSPGA